MSMPKMIAALLFLPLLAGCTKPVTYYAAHAAERQARVQACLISLANDNPWIPERSATRLREADLNILSKLGKQGLEWRLEPEAFTGREVRREDDLLDFPVGCPVDIEVARQPST